MAAIYNEVDSGFMVGAFMYCVKTKGMYTGKDGKFHFPVDKLNGISPYELRAIAPNYFWVEQIFKDNVGTGREKYTGRDVYLKKQDPAKPSLDYGGLVLCERPTSIGAVEANIQYLKILSNEYRKFLHNELAKGTDDAGDRLKQSAAYTASHTK